MIDINYYIEQLVELLKKHFSSRLLYVGLQGSYLRGEATENSDIDIMVVLDELSIQDLAIYRSCVQALDHYDKSCGFICSRKDLANWNPLEICHLLHTTKDYFGQLNEYIPAYTEDDIRNFVKLSVNNLYHEICHRYVHADIEQNIAALAGTYKGVFFILQNLYYLKNHEFAVTKTELLSLLEHSNHDVLKRAIDLNNGNSFDFDDSIQLLFGWCQDTMNSL